MSERDGSLGSFLAGFVIGGLVGAATALILAPHSGSETRSMIASRGNDLRDAGEERIQNARESANQGIDELRQQSHEANQRLHDQARIVLDRGRDSNGEEEQASVADDLTNGDTPADG